MHKEKYFGKGWGGGVKGFFRVILQNALALIYIFFFYGIKFVE